MLYFKRRKHKRTKVYFDDFQDIGVAQPSRMTYFSKQKTPSN